MSEAEQLRELISTMLNSAYGISHSDASGDDLEARYHRLIESVAREADRLPAMCECGEKMLKLKTNWHCDGCGRSRKL